VLLICFIQNQTGISVHCKLLLEQIKGTHHSILDIILFSVNVLLNSVVHMTNVFSEH